MKGLNELRHIVSKLPTVSPPPYSCEVTGSCADSSSPPAVQTPIAALKPPLDTTGSNICLNPAVSQGRIQNIESTVQWRIFQSQLVASDIYPDANTLTTIDHSMPSTDMRLLADLKLRYIQNVHLFNPILNLPTLDDLIVRLAESQFDWSLETCLAALVCAIGAMTEPLKESCSSPVFDEVRSPKSQHYSDPSLATRYWLVAAKRLGIALDRNDIEAVQCLCLTG